MRIPPLCKYQIRGLPLSTYSLRGRGCVGPNADVVLRLSKRGCVILWAGGGGQKSRKIGDGEPGITYLGITESGITESGITWVMGIRHNRNWYNGISYNMEVECGITESGIMESGITRKLDSGIRHNNKRESGITELGITESGRT